MATNSKIRSACNPCHKMKVRCSGDVPCESCSNSGNLCFYSYSGRLGRPRGTKNRRKLDSDHKNQQKNPSDLGRGSSQSSGQELLQRPDYFAAQHNPHRNQHSMSQTPAPFVSNDAMNVNNPAMFDTILENNTNPYPIYSADARQPEIYNGRSFDFSEFFTAEGDSESFLGPTAKDPLYVQEESIHETLPNSSSASSHGTPPSPETAFNNTTIKNSSRQRVGNFAEHNYVAVEVTPVTCSCLQQNTELLCSFKLAEVTEAESAYSIDTVLCTAREALRPWQAVLDCPDCAHNDDQEVLQVAFMTIRLVLVRLQHLIPPWSFEGLERKHGTTEKKTQQQQQKDNTWPNYSARVMLGTFEVFEVDKTIVVQALLLSTIRRIKAMMTRFKETIDRKQKMLQPNSSDSSSTGARNGKQTRNNMQANHGYAAHASSSLYHVQHMLQGLASLLQTLERALEKERS